MSFNNKSEPNCRNCKHYHITYDPQTPNGCRLFQLKSKKMPHMIIKAQSGDFCMGFSEKKKNRDKDQNRY